jgi:molybdopterin molybdotransferase
MLTYREALRTILDGATTLAGEHVPLGGALGLVAADNVLSLEPVPPFTNSAMDGFAVRAEDCAGAAEGSPARLRVLEDVPAGRVASSAVVPGTALRIMTGAPLPRGADAVVPVEDTAASPGEVEVRRPVRPRANVRLEGEDVAAGARVVAAGSVLRPAEIGILAAVGRSRVFAVPRARVAVLTTGDELVDVSENPGPGRIRDSNIHSACAQVAAFGAVPVPFPRVRDRRETVERALREAMESADVVVTTGGISVGEYDFVKEALEALGAEKVFWRVAQKPGGPLGYYRLGGKPLFGIPGNPVASMLMMEEYVRPLLRKMMGFARLHRPERQGVLEDGWSRGRPDGRTHMLRVAVRERDGALHATLTGPQGSGILSSMARANALALIPEGVPAIPEGGPVLLHLTEEGEDH